MKHQYLDQRTVNDYADNDTFRQPLFTCDMDEVYVNPYQGWFNSATWCFALYFGQEPKLLEALRALICEFGDYDQEAVLNLFSWDSGLRIDKDCEGLVYIPEVVEFFNQN